MKPSKEDQSLEKVEKSSAPKKLNELTKSRILKNLGMVSISFLISFTASDGLAIFQSTMNKEVGVISFAVQYACGCIASLFLPKCLIKKFGSKAVLVTSMFAYVPYLSSNFYPVFGFMMPTSILVGFASSLIFNSLATYVNDLAFLYTKLCVKNEFQNHDLNSLRVENKTLENHTKDSPQFYNSVRKHKDSIFITKQSLFGESDESSTDLEVKEKEIALIKFQNSIQKSEKSNLIEENIKNHRNPVKLNNKIQTIFKQNMDLFKDRNEENAASDNHSVDKNKELKRSAENPSGRRNFKTKIPHLSPIPEKSSASEKEIESKIIDEEQKVSFAKSKLPSDEAIKVLETTTSRFFGFFGFVYQICHILSNIISNSIFQNNAASRDYRQNSSCVCGSEFCSMVSACELHNLQVPSTDIRYTLCIVYVVMSFIAALLALLFLDNVKEESNGATFSLDMAIMTFKFHRDKNLLLLIPICIYIGMEQAFYIADFTKDFIGCAWGVEHIPLVTISMGCGLSLCCGLYALLEKHIGRYMFFLASAVLNISVNIVMIYWIPDPFKPAMMFVVAGVIGGVNGILWCQVRAFIGLIFKDEEETAFGCYQLWHALGCAIVFAYSNYICTYVKIYLMLTIFIIAGIGYLLAERNYALSKKQREKT